MTIFVLIAFFLLLSVIVVLLRKFFSSWHNGLAAGMALYLIYRLLAGAGQHAQPQNLFLGYLNYYFLQWAFPFLAHSIYCFTGVSLGVLLHKAVTSNDQRLYAGLLALTGAGVAAAFIIMGFTIRGGNETFALPVDYRTPVHHEYYLLFGLGSSLLCLGLIMLLEKYWQPARAPHWITLHGQHGLFAYVPHWCVIQAIMIFFAKICDKHMLPRLGIPRNTLAWAMVAATIAIVAGAVYFEDRFFARRKVPPQGFVPVPRNLRMKDEEKQKDPRFAGFCTRPLILFHNGDGEVLAAPDGSIAEGRQGILYEYREIGKRH